MTPKEKDLLLGILVLVLLFGAMIVLAFGLTAYYDKQEKVEDCLRPLAKDICHERGLLYGSNKYYQVRCVEDNRTTEGRWFKFTQEEIDVCKEEVKNE